MAKLVEIAARNLNVWFDWEHIWQSTATGVIYDEHNEPIGCVWDIASDAYSGQVTRAQWEAERARIAEAKAAIDKRAEELSQWGMDAWIHDVQSTNQQATAEAREIAKGLGTMLSEIPGGLTDEEFKQVGRKLNKEDQALWDKVASESLQSYLNLCDLSGAVEVFAERACNMADAFMTERANRMKVGA